MFWIENNIFYDYFDKDVVDKFFNDMPKSENMKKTMLDFMAFYKNRGDNISRLVNKNGCTISDLWDFCQK